jgi:GAF domain-containing protein
MDNANALARALSLRVDELYSVPETAEVIALDAVERTGADSAALLLPDGNRWRVAAGVGLGAIERRFELAEDSWVVVNVARASKGVLVEDTDIARRPFHSAPLASRRHLLAAPIRLVDGVLLVARDEDPTFTEESLAILAAVAEEAGLLLAAALDVRELARRLQSFTDDRN